MVAIPSLVLFFFVLLQTTQHIESMKLLNSEIKCYPNYNITARFILSAKRKVLKHKCYHVSVCHPDKNNRFCLDKKALWRKRQCEKKITVETYVVSCHLTPSNLKLCSMQDICVKNHCGEEKTISITPLMRCNWKEWPACDPTNI